MVLEAAATLVASLDTSLANAPPTEVDMALEMREVGATSVANLATLLVSVPMVVSKAVMADTHKEVDMVGTHKEVVMVVSKADMVGSHKGVMGVVMEAGMAVVMEEDMVEVEEEEEEEEEEELPLVATAAERMVTLRGSALIPILLVILVVRLVTLLVTVLSPLVLGNLLSLVLLVGIVGIMRGTAPPEGASVTNVEILVTLLANALSIKLFV